MSRGRYLNAEKWERANALGERIAAEMDAGDLPSMSDADLMARFGENPETIVQKRRIGGAIYWSVTLLCLAAVAVGVAADITPLGVAGLGIGLWWIPGGAVIGLIVFSRTENGIAEARNVMTARAVQLWDWQAARALQARREVAIASGAPVPLLDPPAAQPYGVSPRGAEELVAQWMRSLGDFNAQATQYVGDGGIDVQSDRYIAQVKHYAGTVGVADVRQLAGVASIQHRAALFFTSTGYTDGAVDFANQAGIALFVYSAEHGTLTAVNALADGYRRHGL